MPPVRPIEMRFDTPADLDNIPENHFLSRNSYSRLGLSVGSNQELIKRHYKILARRYHPDKNVGSIEEASIKFRAVQEAYEKLRR